MSNRTKAIASARRKGVLTSGEVAAVCRFSQHTAIRFADAGKLESFRVPNSRARRYRVSDVVRFMRANGLAAEAAELEIVALEGESVRAAEPVRVPADKRGAESVALRVRARGVMTAGELAVLCGVSPRTACGWVDSGVVAGFRIPPRGGTGLGDRRIRLADAARFMRENGYGPESMLIESSERIAFGVAAAVPGYRAVTALELGGLLASGVCVVAAVLGDYMGLDAMREAARAVRAKCSDARVVCVVDPSQPDVREDGCRVVVGTDGLLGWLNGSER